MATFDVLLPVRNGKEFLQESIDSICRQTLKDWRLFVLDHASTDGSLELALRYAETDPRVVVHSYSENLSFSELLNSGLTLCDGKYLLRQDADDLSLPDRMEVLEEAFEANQDLACIGSLGSIINGKGEKIGYIDMPTGRYGVSAASFFRSPICHPSVAIRLDVLHRLGARYGNDFIRALPVEERMSVPALAEDYFLFGQLALASVCTNIDRPLIKYRWHETNVSLKKTSEQLEIALRISRNLARTFSIMHGTAKFDPAPFCNHGERLTDIGNERDFSQEYEVMRQALEKGLPPSGELERELAFRKTLVNRETLPMSARYCSFVAIHGKRKTEWRTVKSWLLRSLGRQPLIKVSSVKT